MGAFGLGRWALGLLEPREQSYTLDLDSTVPESLSRDGL